MVRERKRGIFLRPKLKHWSKKIALTEASYFGDWSLAMGKVKFLRPKLKHWSKKITRAKAS